MADGKLYDLIHYLILLEQAGAQRPDSIEFGKSSNRVKVYINVADYEEAARLISNAVKLQAIAPQQPTKKPEDSAQD